MPFCPNCRYEYEQSMRVCPDCEVELVRDLPPLTEEEAELPREMKDWVQLARLTSREYALMVQEGLRARGIPVVIQSGAGFFGQTGQLGMSSFQPIGGGYSVYVPEEFVVAADIEAQGMLGETWSKSRLVDIEGAENADDEPEAEEEEEK